MRAHTTIATRTATRRILTGLRLLGPALLAAAAVAVSLPGTAQPAFSGTSGKIAFVTWNDDGSYIHVVNADGSGDTQLTATGSDRHPGVSPDGRRIAFSSARDGGEPEIYVMNLDGSGQTRLTNGAGPNIEPSWSPDGQKIAFTSGRDGTYGIYVMDADGSGQTRLTVGSDTHPAWSPDGRKIAFDSIRDGNAEVYVMNADGSGQTQLTFTPDWSYWVGEGEPEWSPDGQKLAFTRYGPSFVGPVGVFVMNADGAGLTRLTDWGSQPAWSPDGLKVAFQDGNDQLSVIDADGSGTATPVTTGYAAEPSWGPLVAQATRTATVQQPINADGSSVFQVGRGVLPVKFALAVDGVPTCTLPPATIALARLSGAVAGPVNESVSTGQADSGSDFRTDDCQYIYNLSLKSLTAGTYRVTIAIDGQVAGSATFEVR